eukprot:TRINITY_DN981_c0_g2_i1.p3 TRINITY_DN981_c0_g2~~TRINITY_DN981_c0_g2_i1.p3  ORF type:complete len:163 (-),score=48.05 TRINITY_DN981_c0_g2_i1:686-1174(-)
MLFTPEYPIVVKVGSAEAGYGKMKFDATNQFNDFRGCIAMYDDFATIESFVENRAYDLRIQKIGDKYRSYKRTSSNWKGNVGSSIVEEIEMEDIFMVWIDEASSLFGGMDILTVDAIRTEDGRDFILEINDCASGFLPNREEEDMGHVRDLIINRLEDLIAG